MSEDTNDARHAAPITFKLSNAGPGIVLALLDIRPKRPGDLDKLRGRVRAILPLLRVGASLELEKAVLRALTVPTSLEAATAAKEESWPRVLSVHFPHDQVLALVDREFTDAGQADWADALVSSRAWIEAAVRRGRASLSALPNNDDKASWARAYKTRAIENLEATVREAAVMIASVNVVEKLEGHALFDAAGGALLAATTPITAAEQRERFLASIAGLAKAASKVIAKFRKHRTNDLEGGDLAVGAAVREYLLDMVSGLLPVLDPEAVGEVEKLVADRKAELVKEPFPAALAAALQRGRVRLAADARKNTPTGGRAAARKIHRQC